MYEHLTVVTPIKESESLLPWFIQMKWLLSDAKWLVFDSGGGQELKELCSKYVCASTSEWNARLLLYDSVDTLLVLNLDCWNILPKQYVDEAYLLLRDDQADVTAIDYEESIGHYGFGTSMWKKNVLNETYDFPPRALELALTETGSNESHVFRYTVCECTYMWNRLFNLKKRFVPLLYKAKNLRPH